MSKQDYVEFSLPKKLFQDLETQAKRLGKTTDELAVEAVRQGLMRVELVKVTIKIPGLLLKLLEEQNYFGWTKEEFFVEAVKAGIGIVTSNMDSDECAKLYKKYGKKIDVTYLPNGYKTWVVGL